MQVYPSKELLPYIRHYLFLESGGAATKKLRLFSDGHMGIVFSFKDRLAASIQGGRRADFLPHAFMYGQVTAFKDLYLAGETALLVVVFQPNGVNRLLGLPAKGITNTTVCITDILGKQGDALAGRLAESQVWQEKLQLLDRFFGERMFRKTYAQRSLIPLALDFILAKQGSVTVQQLVRYTGYTERQLERVFNESVGLTPKKFGSIVQLHHFLKLLKDSVSENTLTALSYEAGYADQSHLVKTFKKFTGITPSQYLNHTNRLAINFMELIPA